MSDISPEPTPPIAWTRLTDRTVTDALTTRHTMLLDQLISWSIANPGKPFSHAAVAFRLNPLYVRKVVSTDAFRARYAELSGRIIEEAGIMGLKEKIAAAADIAIERLGEKLAVSESVPDLIDGSEMLLNQLYGKGGSGAVPAASVTVQQQIIMEGRAKIVGVVTEAQPEPPCDS